MLFLQRISTAITALPPCDTQKNALEVIKELQEIAEPVDSDEWAGRGAGGIKVVGWRLGATGWSSPRRGAFSVSQCHHHAGAHSPHPCS